MSVLAVPRSIARSLENQPKIELRITNFAACLPGSGLDAGTKDPTRKPPQDAAQMLKNCLAETFGSRPIALRDKLTEDGRRRQVTGRNCAWKRRSSMISRQC